jgi:hypothetical protein
MKILDNPLVYFVFFEDEKRDSLLLDSINSLYGGVAP